MGIPKTVKLLLAVIIILLSILFVIWTGGLLHEDTREDEIPPTAEAYLQKARSLQMEQKLEEAYKYYEKATLFALMIEGDQEKELQALKGWADCAFYLGVPDSCLYPYTRVASIAHELNKSEEEYYAYSQLKRAYITKMDMQNATLTEWKLDSLEQITSDKAMPIRKYLRLETEAILQQNIKLAEQYLLKAESLLASLPLTERLSGQFLVWGELRNFYWWYVKDYEKARKYSKLYIDACKKGFGQQQFSYMPSYSAEALICANQREKKAAFVALDSMKYGLNFSEESSPRTIMQFYKTQGMVFSLFEEWEKACEAFRQALLAVDDSYVKNSPEYFEIIKYQAWALYQTRQYDYSKASYYKYADFCKYQYGEISLAYSDALVALAEFERQRGNAKNGKQFYIESVDICMNLVKEQLRYASILERDAFWLSFAPKIWNMSAYAVSTNDQQSLFTEKCYNALLFSKSLLLESDRSMTEAINTECTPQEQYLYSKMQDAQNQLKMLMNNHDNNKDKIETLYQKISALNRQLVPIISRLGYTSFLNQDYENIKELLEEDEVVIDFTDFMTDEQEHVHAAFIIKQNQTHPKLIKTFTEGDINRLLERESDNLPTYFLYNENLSEEAYNLIWKPLANEIKGAKTVYYAPSGMMHRIALEALLLKDRTRLGDHYGFVRLTSVREIAKLKKRSPGTTHATAALYGALKYDMDTITMSKEASRYKVSPLFTLDRGESARGKVGFKELPNAKEEMNRIVNVLTKKGAHVRVRTGMKGTEESFLALSGKSTDILHVATHGFFYTPEQAKDVTYLKGFNDAMQLSGLIMSGGNLAWTGKQVPKGVLGGVMTASNIASMDLRGTDLVVLSACQTGLGIATPEGLYGLQRAFKKAGVQTMVVTLWSVDDEATKDFMVKFYEELAANQWDKRAAFEKTKEFIREKTYIRNGKSYKGDPYYWAGFVMLD
jgi:CHAT domain-containing protein